VSERHPRQVLLGAQARSAQLPVCDHYCGTEPRMRKALALQAELTATAGTCLFDVTLDCEDGAPVGREAEHAALVADIALSAPPGARVAVRVHPVDHPAFAEDVAVIVGRAGPRLVHLMLPKVESPADVDRAARAVDAAGGARLPLHALIESPAAVHRAFDIAAHPRIQSLSFGLMDFVSAHDGAIPADAMTAEGQFAHPLVLRAKLEIVSACHANGKVPSHAVVTEYKDPAAISRAALRAARELGHTRMWSIHPDQIRPIVDAFAPDDAAIHLAAEILAAGAHADWAPIAFDGSLHDRASYRHYWHLLERAHRTGRALPAAARRWFADTGD